MSQSISFSSKVQSIHSRNIDENRRKSSPGQRSSPRKNIAHEAGFSKSPFKPTSYSQIEAKRRASERSKTNETSINNTTVQSTEINTSEHSNKQKRKDRGAHNVSKSRKESFAINDSLELSFEAVHINAIKAVTKATGTGYSKIISNDDMKNTRTNSMWISNLTKSYTSSITFELKPHIKQNTNEVLEIRVVPFRTRCPKKCVIETSNTLEYGAKILHPGWEFNDPVESGKVNPQTITFPLSKVAKYITLTFHGTFDYTNIHRISCIDLTYTSFKTIQSNSNENEEPMNNTEDFYNAAEKSSSSSSPNIDNSFKVKDILNAHIFSDEELDSELYRELGDEYLKMDILKSNSSFFQKIKAKEHVDNNLIDEPIEPKIINAIPNENEEKDGNTIFPEKFNAPPVMHLPILNHEEEADPVMKNDNPKFKIYPRRITTVGKFPNLIVGSFSKTALRPKVFDFIAMKKASASRRTMFLYGSKAEENNNSMELLSKGINSSSNDQIYKHNKKDNSLAHHIDRKELLTRNQNQNNNNILKETIIQNFVANSAQDVQIDEVSIEENVKIGKSMPRKSVEKVDKDDITNTMDQDTFKNGFKNYTTNSYYPTNGRQIDQANYSNRESPRITKKQPFKATSFNQSTISSLNYSPEKSLFEILSTKLKEQETLRKELETIQKSFELNL